MRIPRILIAAPGSGSGKTLLTCALLRLLGRRGIRAAAFKCGPDFIDPMFHKKVLGTPSRNLDLYLAGEDGVRRSFAAGCTGAQIAVIEGVMGYFDGTGASDMEGSSYHLASVLQAPVLLAADVRGMSRSAAALIKGFADYGEQRMIRGAFLNRVSPAMADRISGWLKSEAAIPVLGSFPLDETLCIESRHLGLVEPDEIPDLLQKIDHAADLLEQTLNLKLLLEIAGDAPVLRVEKERLNKSVTAAESAREDSAAVSAREDAAAKASPVTIAVAEDEAFSFYYEDNLELLEELGAEIVSFSPLHDTSLPEADGLLIGGGYPELRAQELAANTFMVSSIRRAAEQGMPILAECGGFQYLQEELVDSEGIEHRMCGVLKGFSRMTKKLVRFGYVEVSGEGGYFGSGQTIRGHEFHYSDSTDNGNVCRAVKPDGRSWDCMVVQGRITAGYPHLYYRSDPAFAEAFVAECRKFREERGRN
ncbi:MAG: cobyrinate a,c-diamide synthase [Lachnospiraceae bacterium]|nr:cobyrinate a,c-diamide synthase [Lachnospiraceae bacterium]